MTMVNVKRPTPKTETLQTRILDAIRAQATASGFDTVETPEWANTGTLRFMRPGTFAVTASLRYNFQSGDAQLNLQGGSPTRWDYAGGIRMPYDAAMPAKMRILLQDLESLLS
jgi:hypothetical protein